MFCVQTEVRSQKNVLQVMAVPVDQDGRVQEDPDEVFWRGLDTRLAGGQTVPAADANKVRRSNAPVVNQVLRSL